MESVLIILTTIMLFIIVNIIILHDLSSNIKDINNNINDIDSSVQDIKKYVQQSKNNLKNHLTKK